MSKQPEQGRGESAEDGRHPLTPQQRALYQDLRDTYQRLCVLARDERYDRLAEEVRRTDTLLHELKRGVRPVGADPAMITGGPNPYDGANQDSSGTESLLTEVLHMRERALQALGVAMADTQTVLRRLDYSHRALGRYRVTRSREPRLQSCRA